MLHRNQHVVCIDDTNWRIKDDGPNPVKGTVYTVAEYDGVSFDEPSIQLQEFPPDEKYMEKWFRSWRFRPLKPIKVEDFLKTKVPVLEDV